MYNIGVVFFKDIINPNVGIAYSETYLFQKINKITELDNNIIWFSNIKDTSDFDNVKNSNYFGNSLNSIIYRLGLKEEKVEKVIKELYYLFDKIINKLIKNYNIRIENDQLTEEIFKILDFKKYNFNDLEIKDILKNITSAEFTSLNANKNKKPLYLSSSKYSYVKELCKTMIPIGQWKKMTFKEIENKPSDWFCKIANKHHFLASVKLTNIDKELVKVLPSKYLKNKIWINNYEFEFLEKLCEIYVDELYVSKTRIYLEEIEPKKLFKIKKQEESYISNYIAANNYINAFQKEDNIISYWLKMQDKTNMLKIAFIFSKYGIEVNSYGSGSLLVYYDNTKEEISKIIKLSEKLGLNYPLELLFFV